MLITVSKQANADFSTLQSALDYIPSGSTESVTLRIKPGVYEEKVTVRADAPPILLLGDDAASTIISWSDNAHTLDDAGQPLGTFRSGTLNVLSEHFTAENVTIRNASGPGTGQAVAAFVDAGYAVFRRARLLGDQDTLYTGKGKQYYDECYIEGDVDYIFGAATALFDRCHLHTKRSRGYITAASTPENEKFGYVFLDCAITGGEGVSEVYLGRPWRSFAHVALIRTTIDASIIPEGWHNWGQPDRESTSRYEEFGSRGPGANPNARAEWSRQLSTEEAAGYRVIEILDGWHPEGYGLERRSDHMNPHQPNTLENWIRTLSESVPRRSEWQADIPFDQWHTQLSQRFRQRLGEFPSEPADLNPLLLERTQCDGYIRERIEITTYEGLRMPLYLLIPDQALPNSNAQKGSHDPDSPDPRPVVLAIHGHGCGSREIVGLHPDGSARKSQSGLHKDFALSLVRQGFVVVAPELLGFGDRRLAEDLALAAEDPGKNSCFRLSSALLMAGQTMAGYRIYETMRALDYVQTRREADSGRVGIMGISGGGLVAGFTAALDPRIACAVVSGYTNTFAASILSRNHCLDNYIPGILLEAEMPDLLGLIAPRGLFVEAGANDHLFGPAGVREALDRLQVLFQASGRPNGIEADLFEGGHEIHGNPAFAWLNRQLMMATKEVRHR